MALGSLDARETFYVLFACTDPQKVCAAFTSRNRLLSCTPVAERHTVPKGQLTDLGNRARSLRIAPFGALHHELGRRHRKERGV